MIPKYTNTFEKKKKNFVQARLLSNSQYSVTSLPLETLWNLALISDFPLPSIENELGETQLQAYPAHGDSNGKLSVLNPQFNLNAEGFFQTQVSPPPLSCMLPFSVPSDSSSQRENTGGTSGSKTK